MVCVRKSHLSPSEGCWTLGDWVQWEGMVGAVGSRNGDRGKGLGPPVTYLSPLWVMQ